MSNLTMFIKESKLFLSNQNYLNKNKQSKHLNQSGKKNFLLLYLLNFKMQKFDCSFEITSFYHLL